MPDGIYISNHRLKNRLGVKLGPYFATNRYRYAGFSDNEFYIPTRQEIETFLNHNPINPGKLYDESFDCDDYAFVLKGSVSLYVRNSEQFTASMCIGIAWGMFQWAEGLHACNWALDSDFELIWIEPQNGEIYNLSECRGNLELLIA